MSNSTANQIIQPKTRTLILYAARITNYEGEEDYVDVIMMEVLGILVRTDHPFGSAKSGFESGVIDYLVVDIHESLSLSDWKQMYWLTTEVAHKFSDYREFIWNAWPPEKDEEMIRGGFVAFRKRAASYMEIAPWCPEEHPEMEAKGQQT